MAGASLRQRSILARVFVSPDEPRLRAGWRLAGQTLLMALLFAILAIGLGLFFALAAGSDAGVPADDTSGLLLNQFLELMAIGPSVYVARRFLDRRSFASLGLILSPQALTDIIAGITITGFMMGLIYLIHAAAGWLTLEAFAWDIEPAGAVVLSSAGFLGILVLVGWNEELLTRGYYLQTLESGFDLRWGVIISSAVFGLAHLGNPHATWISAGGIVLAGLFLAYGYVLTRQLWLSIGLHIGWNFFEGVVFGFPVSGLSTFRLARIQVAGPEIWTGGAFGPEAGLVIVPGLLLGAAMLYAYSTRLRDRTE